MSWGLTEASVTWSGGPWLDEVSLPLDAGEVAVVVGGDGAGKTTTLHLAAGLRRPDRGAARHPRRERIGAMLEVPGVYGDLTVDENVRFTAGAYGLARRERDTRSGELLERAGLAAARSRLAADLSGGMRQQLAVVLALLHRPDLLVLDEPTTGVDPVSRAEVWRLIGHAAAEGAAVLVATTYLDEAERARRVLVLDAGAPLLHGTPDVLTEAGRWSFEEIVIAAQRERRAAAVSA
ncbi:MAG TPA: ABC transporter ATP-binding protein [Egicoccus sp.]|nr:ABC transporter ATP-binding protein [Egicoccus sp.]HSK22436.1 ABC transporter ATP-binding protein [Egicoccus sp.]